MTVPHNATNAAIPKIREHNVFPVSFFLIASPEKKGPASAAAAGTPPRDISDILQFGVIRIYATDHCGLLENRKTVNSQRCAWHKSGAEADEPEFLHFGRSLHRLVLNLQEVMAHKPFGKIGAVEIGQLRKSEKNLDNWV